MLFGKVVASHLDNSIAKASVCNQSGTASLFLSSISCSIYNMADKHVITLIPAYICNHLNVEADYLSMGQLAPEQHIFPNISTLGSIGVYYIPVSVRVTTHWKIHHHWQPLG